jgi:hypothetical protein
MALISCTECRGQVSDQAATCPHCGAPLKASKFNAAPPKKTGCGTIFLGILGVAVVIGGIIFIMNMATSSISYDSGSSSALTSSTSSRCVPATSAQMANIRAGVQGDSPKNDVKTGYAVKSHDFANVWMVAAKIYGPSIENGAGPGVWAISGDPNAPGLTYAVDGYAKSFSDWGDASKTDAAITSFSDGVQEAKACVR